MKRVVLIQPPSGYLLEPLWKIPLTIYSLKTYLEDRGFAVEVVDLAEASEDGPWPIPLDADLYAMSVYTPQHTVAIKIANFLRERTRAVIIAGGHHVTAIKEQFLLGSSFDAIVLGEGEIALGKICEGKPFDEIEGIIYQKNGHIRATGPQERIKNLSTIPLPRYTIEDLKKYKGNLIEGSDNEFHIGVVTSRGCYFRCSFCSSRFFWHQKVTWHPVEQILDYLEYLYHLGVRSFEFLDDNFIVHPGFEQILKYLAGRGVAWSCMGRSDRVTEEKADLMRKSGCTYISLGIESGSNRMLKLMEKSETVEDHIRAIDILHRAQVPIKGLMIAGFPGEDEEDARLTEKFIIEQPVDHYAFCAFVPLPGTPVWHYPEKFGAVIDRRIPFEEYLLVSKDFGPRPILENHETATRYLNRYLDAAGARATNVKAFERMNQKMDL